MRWWVPPRFAIVILFVLVLMQSVSLAQLNSAAAAAAASTISKQVSMQEWLGPLSAIALSPFFGLACLSGAATYGPEWLQSRSALFGPASPLNNPLLFWVMLVLTVTTSLPRFTKVSKPFALAVEKLEMYSVVIILISMKFMSGSGMDSDSGVSHSESMVLTAGVTALPMDVLLSIAAAVNIVVVNTIKLAIELLVWLIPFPTVDAILEVCNKALAGTLMSLYAYSPFLSTLLNLGILVICCLVFFRVKRRMAYMKELMMLPLIGRLLGWSSDDTKFIGFLAKPWNGFPVNSAFQVSRLGAPSEVQLLHRGWTKHRTFSGTTDLASYRTGIVCDQLCVYVDGQEVAFDVSKGLEGRSAIVAAGV